MTDNTLYQFIGLGEPSGPQWEERDTHGYARCVTVLGRVHVCNYHWYGMGVLQTQCYSIDHGKQLAAEHYRRTITSVLRVALTDFQHTPIKAIDTSKVF